MDQSDQSQHRDGIRYHEGLEPVIYHEGAFLQPVVTGTLQVEDHGLEVVPSENPYQVQYPQVLFGKEEKEVCHSNTTPPETDAVQPSNSNPRRRSKRRWWWMAAVVTAIVMAGMIAGIGEGLQHKRKRTAKEAPAVGTTPPNNITSSPSNNTLNLNTSEPSTTWAFNGTGLSIVPSHNVFDEIFMYFQHSSGEIRYSQLTDSGWSGGESAQRVISSNVKNGTRLTGISTQAGNVSTRYLFYVDDSGTVQDVHQWNNSNGYTNWSSGTIGSLKIWAADTPNAAFDVCWEKSWYGSNVGNSPGLRLYIGEQDGLVHEYILDQDSNKWSTGYIFLKSNGNAGAICWPGVISYLYMQNSQETLQLWWKDYNSDAINSTTHPPSGWVEGSLAAGLDVRPNSSLAVSYHAYFQDSKSRIFGISRNATAGASCGATFQVGGGTAMPETTIECQTFFPSTNSPSGIYVFFQPNASNPMEYVRP
ncbi:hypothetical protein LPUS_11955 [Lasallia pustulata]|uniref:Fucose-specific lectin n=1 Tax=Lasallia pustulata TaxID=136370 RepID=A0A1W5DD18_9LECA|nr:hypothetical protein LPUS_11955 [Lasallia pustulata]